jgi:hypothetical protein
MEQWLIKQLRRIKSKLSSSICYKNTHWKVKLYFLIIHYIGKLSYRIHKRERKTPITEMIINSWKQVK